MNREFLADALRGLTKSPKTLPCKWFYDEIGSRLFEEICQTPEYYPTRTEASILRDNAREIARRIGRDVALLELGSGSSEKTPALLSALETPRIYIPLDISPTVLHAAAKYLREQFPDIEIWPLEADYTRPMTFPPALLERMSAARRVLFFPGSTIGNFSRPEMVSFLRTAATWGDRLIVGVDLPKPLDVLLPAYNDAGGVTARFNLNILARLNRECGANFDCRAFKHRAVWNAPDSRIEMQLISQREQTVRLATEEISFADGEILLTEFSHKLPLAEFSTLAQSAGWHIEEVWCDQNNWFSIHLLRVC